jgi:hypothetical protein
MGKSFEEQRSFVGKAIDIRGLDVFFAVTAQSIRSQGIYGDDQHIEVRFCRSRPG